MIYINKCNVCPHKCSVNRENNQLGFCKASSKIKIALATLFYYEEPCISGTNGSGAVFFSNCNLRCVYCQNYEISQEGKGKEITVEELANIFLELQEKKAHNINLVTPTIYAMQIKESIIIAKRKGLKLPIIYNCNGYENIETIKQLDGYIDIYLPDFKYSSNELGIKYSKINNYFDNATKAILYMNKQVGNPKFNSEGIMQKGMIIRNLILPNQVKNTKRILDWIVNNIGKDAYVSVMSQYFPTYKTYNFEEINRKITRKELNIIENYLYKLELENGYIQDLEKQEKVYVPKF